MRTHWRQSIRWRLALGSMLVALLATTLLALSAILAISYYYGVDQGQRLASLAVDKAQSISENYTQSNNLLLAAKNTLPAGFVHSFIGEQYVLVVINPQGQFIFPPKVNNKPTRTAFFVALADPSLRTGDFNGLRTAIQLGLQGTSSTGSLGSGGLTLLPRPFVVQPIIPGGQSNAPVVGALLIVSRSAGETTLPPLIATIGRTVLIAAAIIAALATLAAILFARTITRPLAYLTKAARVLASGDYNARVSIKAHGELEELANTFNEMAAKLASDVNVLQRQEVWQRELIMNITHDLATPLTAIAGLGESLVDGVNQSREDYEATGRIVVRETLRLRRLVKDLHMMAKAETGAMQPQWKAVRLAALVDEVLAVLATEFERANVEPVNAIPYNLPFVQADPDMLTRVFSNLCDNALRHTPAGGTVTIEAIQRDNQLLVSVADSGEGIPTGALPRVFERFYRADSSRQVITGGSGLGLAIVRAIIEGHGGTIWAENIPGGGARFVFTLPLKFSEPASITGAITIPMTPTKF
jgi:signal transduction histidine kinase